MKDEIQIVRYACCNGILAACCVPDCYSDEDWKQELQRYARIGLKIEIIENPNGKLFEHSIDCKNEFKK